MKQRVYKRNKDTLMQLERDERIAKVEETVQSVQADYERLLERMKKLKADEMVDKGTASSRQRGKRKTIVEDEDEVDDGDEGGEEEEDGVKSATKRQKLNDEG